MHKHRKKKEKSSASMKDMKIIADFSSLQKPVDTSASDLYQVCKLLENGTEEVKSILSYECNIIYECRTCLSLFRSIINLISHKRVYCIEKFNVTQKVVNKNNLNSFKKTTIHMSETGQTKIEEIAKNERLLRSQVCKEMKKKTDLSSIIEKLNKKIQETQCSFISEPTPGHSNSLSENESNELHKICLKPIRTTSSAVYQTIKPVNEIVDLLNEEASTKIEHLSNQQVDAISQEQIFDNQVEKSDSPIQADLSDEENTLLAYRLSSMNTLACNICNAKFSSKKTLTFHKRSLHASKRKCYSCPYCRSTFTNTWSVYRHLNKVHKKTNRQVRNLRPQIRLAVFHQNTNAEKQCCAATKEKTSETSETLKNMANNESQKDDAMNHVEKSVVKRSAKPNRQKSKKTSMSVYLQYHNNHRSGNSHLVDTSRVQDDDDKPVIIERVPEQMTDEKDISEDVTDGFLKINDKSSDSGCTRDTNLPRLDENNKDISLTDVKVAFIENFNRSNSDKSSDTDLFQLDEKEKTSQMDTKIASIANFKKLKCLICNRKFTSIPNLRRHMAIHIGWSRYRCKLCGFQSFTKCECKTHFTKHHRTVENNNANLEEIIEKIPLNEHVSSDDAITTLMNERERLNNTGVANASSEEEKTDESVVTDVTIASSNLEIRADTNNLSDSNASAVSHEAANEEITDSHCNNSGDDRKFKTAYTTAMIEDLKEYMMSHDTGKSNKNLDQSDLKQMVMEMIVGSDDSDPTSKVKKSDSEKLASQATNDVFKHRVDAKDNNNLTTDKSKEANPRPDHFKHKRPMRNRVRPLNDDFIYDLKEIQLKRECAFSNDSEASARKKTK